MFLLSAILVFIHVSCGSFSSEDSLRSILISKHDVVTQEEYYNGASADDLQNVQSITKSVITILIGVAIEEGYISDISVPIKEFLVSEYEQIENASQTITIAHLINHTSGLKWDGYQEHEGWMNSDNPIAYFLQKQQIHGPGKAYNYNSAGTHVLSVILSRATGMTTLQYATKKLFDPLDFGEVSWELRRDGYHDGAGFGLSMRSKDLLSLGQLLINDGIVKEQQIIPLSWIELMLNDPDKRITKWGMKNSTHGSGWYTGHSMGKDIHYSMGYGGQFLFLLPFEKKVIVVNHDHDTADGISQQVDFLKHTLPSLLSD